MLVCGTMNNISLKRTVEYKSYSKIGNYNKQGMVTFSYDDGLLNNYDIALPLHEKYGIPATFNIIGRRTIKKEYWDRYMNGLQVKDMHRRGMEIASHSYWHDAQLPTKTDEEIYFEFEESNRILNFLVRDIETIAIPFSQYDERVKEIAKQYYKGIRVHEATVESIPPVDRHELVSVSVNDTTSFEEIKGWIDEAVENNKWSLIMLHGINTDGDNLSALEITSSLLEETLNYIYQLGTDNILPVTTKEGLQISLRDEY